MSSGSSPRSERTSGLNPAIRRRDSAATRVLPSANIAAKLIAVTLALYPLWVPDLPQFRGKAMRARIRLFAPAARHPAHVAAAWSADALPARGRSPAQSAGRARRRRERLRSLPTRTRVRPRGPRRQCRLGCVGARRGAVATHAKPLVSGRARDEPRHLRRGALGAGGVRRAQERRGWSCADLREHDARHPGLDYRRARRCPGGRRAPLAAPWRGRGAVRVASRRARRAATASTGLSNWRSLVGFPISDLTDRDSL